MAGSSLTVEEVMDDDNEAVNKKFKKAVEKAKPQIDECLRIARLALEDAERLSDKYGVPYYDDIQWSSRQYVPESFMEQGFNQADDSLLEQVGIYDSDYIETGWASSYC